MDKSVVVVKAVRTTVGRRNGGWSAVHPARLLGAAQRAVLDGVDPAVVGQVIGGTVTEVGEQSFNVTPHRLAGRGPAAAGAGHHGPRAVRPLAAGVHAGRGPDRRGHHADAAIACGVGELMSRVPIGASDGKELGLAAAPGPTSGMTIF